MNSLIEQKAQRSLLSRDLTCEKGVKEKRLYLDTHHVVKPVASLARLAGNRTS